MEEEKEARKKEMAELEERLKRNVEEIDGGEERGGGAEGIRTDNGGGERLGGREGGRNHGGGEREEVGDGNASSSATQMDAM